LQVADLTRSRAFYAGVLGLRVVGRGDGRLVLGPQEADTPLVELVEQPGAQPAPRRDRLGLYHVAFLLPSRDALGAFVRHLADQDVRVGRSDHRVSEALYLTDPDGLGIEVYADRPRAAWGRTEEGEIAMTTEPLDTQALLDATPDASWAGMPAGTTIGHVHLHVGDLERAESFYHEALGFDKTVWTYPGALFLSAGSYHHHVGTNVWAGDARPAGADEAQLLEWTLLVPDAEDVDAAADCLEDAGAPVTRDAPACRTQDPWGTALRIAPGA
jgi:catechol 2,3-dioxygenase